MAGFASDGSRRAGGALCAPASSTIFISGFVRVAKIARLLAA